MAQYRHVKEPQKEEKKKGNIDFLLLIIVTMLSIFGIIMVFDSSIKLLSNKYHFVILQSLWVTLGFISMFILSQISYKKIAKLSLILIVINIFFLILVLFIGKSTNGAFRWINIASFQFQPSELMKPIFILYLASSFAKEKPKFKTHKERFRYSFVNELIPFLILTMFIILLIIIGKDLGTAIIIGSIALGMYFVQGNDFISIFNLLASIAAIALAGVVAIAVEPYRLKRLLNFSGTSNNPLKEGYQISQVLIAIGSGGWLGKGFTQSIQKQRYLVETTAATDSIFAVIAEEFGFVGSLILFVGYMFFAYRCIAIATKIEDKLGRYIVMGITIWIVTQALLNIAVNVNLVPLTGVPLPFISYGGSSTIILLSSIGIILNISKHRYEKHHRQ